MIGNYPSAKIEAPEIYVAELVNLLVNYEHSEAAKAIQAAMAESPNFLPPVPVLRQTLQKLRSRPALDWAEAWDLRANAQRAERKRIESGEEVADQTGERARVMAGFAALLKQLRPAEEVEREKEFTPERVMKKYGLTQEQWDAIPDQPEDASYWRGVRKPKDMP